MATMTSPRMEEVLEQEEQQIETSRNLRLGEDFSRPLACDSLVGLAFSGGGIRSATFNLGILQALARERLLRAFDYVSTVSGGGYIGGWLMAWMHHQKIGIPELEEKLSAESKPPNQSADPPELHFLRNYSNYLTPRMGVLSTDFWAFVGGYLRNTLLNQTILVLAFLSLLLLPRALACFVYSVFPKDPKAAIGLAGLVGLLLEFLAVLAIGFNLVSIYQTRGKQPTGSHRVARSLERWLTGSSGIQCIIILPLLLSAALFAYGMEKTPPWQIRDHPWISSGIWGCALYFLFWAISLLINKVIRLKTKAEQSEVEYENPAAREGENCKRCRHFIPRDPDPQCRTVKGPHRAEGGCVRFGTKDDTPSALVILGTALIAGFITGFLYNPLEQVLFHAGTKWDIWNPLTFGTPFMVGMMLITGVLHIGLMGREMIDKHREWWGRLGGLLMIYAAGWLVLFLIAIYFPWKLGTFLSSHEETTIKGLTVSGLVWAASTAYGVLFGKSESSALSLFKATNSQKLWHYLARVTPYIFILGVLLGLSLLASEICAVIARHWESLQNTTLWSFPPDAPSWWVSLGCILFLMAAIVLSLRVDINEFSVHYLYRNRLIRCYLGASRPERYAQPFTGFSDRDNFPLASLKIPEEFPQPKDARPFLIVNTSLNVVGGKELALQSRKARSFAFTPLYGGFTRQPPGERDWEACFGLTAEAACQRTAYQDGITMGTCMAVSGAAASPNMGSYSQPGLAFLMTLFDVRLGWWIGNPTSKWWRRGSPGIGFFRLLSELLGRTNDTSNFLYLSDGGHFENLGIYELVRRRCKVIVACDASCDKDYTMGDLHTAMEHCRTDFGVNITLDHDEDLLKPTDSQGELRSKQHFVIGTIHYPGRAKGTIIYIKLTLVDGDPEDVLAYKRVNPHFPHNATIDQWFDEAHFENYRALGEAAGRSAIAEIRGAIKHAVSYDPEELRLEKIPA